MAKIKKGKILQKSLNSDFSFSPIVVEVTPFPIIGIGASAGGLRAFEAFFSGMPHNIEPNMAFVLVQHLSPDHKSILSEILQRSTSMHVFEVEDGMVVEINCVYIIPPNRDMALINGNLQLLEPTSVHTKRLPIDFFFSSLAQDQLTRAIGIILSGTGSDGTQGLLAIKAVGGMVIAQKPDSCEYDGMPSSAIATGLVDYELLPDEMPIRLMEYVSHSFNPFSLPSYSRISKSENELRKIFILLRDHTGHDFSQYKTNTMDRRIERRMVLNHIETIEAYTKYLQNTTAEVEALFYELLIGVTSFFRDTDSFKSLKKILPKIFEKKKSSDTIRIWSVGCSTGEEAYSLAILLKEYMLEHKINHAVQVFATDIDANAIAVARMGIYPANIVTEVSKERIKHFFTLDADTGKYRINKNIRDMLVFSEQNITKHPPFSRLDLISCRNLLIYMNADLQKKIIPIFHYSLNPEGILFLGSSETIGEFSNLFDTLDSKSKLFERKNYIQGEYRMAQHLSNIPYTLAPQITGKIIAPVKIPLQELTENTLLKQITTAAILVNEKGDILYLHGSAGKYLELPAGEIGTNNIFKMTHSGLQRGLIVSLHKLIETKETVRDEGVKVNINGQFITLNIILVPVSMNSVALSKSTLYLIVLEKINVLDTENEDDSDKQTKILTDTNAHVLRLRQELYAQEEFLKTSSEELNISNEELRSSNEEIQSMNEELQSSNEELETSREELQSVNEELSTVNAELQMKVVDLSHANNDMNNLLAGTGIGTIFVDHDLKLLRFTPAVTKIINLILSDLGRPIDHITTNINEYNNLKEDLQEVLNTLITQEREIQTKDEKYYLMRIAPYRTQENVIEGAVITFVEVTEIVKMREALSEANTKLLRMAVIVQDANDAIIMQGLDGKILAWNAGAVKMYGWSEEQALKMNMKEMIPKIHKQELLSNIKTLKKEGFLNPYNTKRITKEGVVINIWVTATVLLNKDAEIYAIARTEQEIKAEVK